MGILLGFRTHKQTSVSHPQSVKCDACVVMNASVHLKNLELNGNWSHSLKRTWNRQKVIKSSGAQKRWKCQFQLSQDGMNDVIGKGWMELRPFCEEPCASGSKSNNRWSVHKTNWTWTVLRTDMMHICGTDTRRQLGQHLSKACLRGVWLFGTGAPHRNSQNLNITILPSLMALMWAPTPRRLCEEHDLVWESPVMAASSLWTSFFFLWLQQRSDPWTQG